MEPENSRVSTIGNRRPTQWWTGVASYVVRQGVATPEADAHMDDPPELGTFIEAEGNLFPSSELGTCPHAFMKWWQCLLFETLAMYYPGT